MFGRLGCLNNGDDNGYKSNKNTVEDKTNSVKNLWEQNTQVITKGLEKLVVSLEKQSEQKYTYDNNERVKKQK